MKAQSEHPASPACIICGFQETRRKTESGRSALWSCPFCGADFVFPAPGGELFVPPSEYNGRSELSAEFLAQFERKGEKLSLLDVGCGDGIRLAMALGRGWRCFGVEPSISAHASAEKNVGAAAFLTDRVEHLVPCVFDVILLLNVLEYCPDPMRFFYTLFTRGAIQPHTTVVISNLNKVSFDSSLPLHDGSTSARFVWFSVESLKLMMAKLRFKQVAISSLHELLGQPAPSLEVGPPESGNLSRDCAEIAIVASGSDFHAFMKERYVPGTWLDLALYEHLPRYLLAGGLARQKTVLDLGCGTGYGAALLARGGAASVLGLDIDPSTIEWAQNAHSEKNLSFCVRTDLGAGLAPESFDLITCFEMIEHVAEPVQHAVIASIARLLRKNGVLLISTPNPVVTALYGENPFHLRELTEHEFLELLSKHFEHIKLNYQFIHEGTLITPNTRAVYTDARIESLSGTAERPPAAAFIAVCSNGPLPNIPVSDFVDNADLVGSKVRTEHYINRLQIEYFKLFETAQGSKVQLPQRDLQTDRTKVDVEELKSRNLVLRDLLAATSAKLRSLEASSLVRFERAIREERWSFRKARKIGSILASMAANGLRTCLPGLLPRKINGNVQKISPKGESKARSDHLSDRDNLNPK